MKCRPARRLGRKISDSLLGILDSKPQRDPLMFKVFRSIEDKIPLLIVDSFKEASNLAKTTLEADPWGTIIYIFFQNDSSTQDGQQKLAGIVTRKEVTEFMNKRFVFLDIQYETAFGQINNQYCHEPSLLATCLKILSFNNKIIAILPITQKDFYLRLANRTPSNS